MTPAASYLPHAGNIPLSKKFCFFIGIQRLAIAEEFNDKPAERRACSNLGNAHVFLGEFEVAAEYYKWEKLFLCSESWKSSFLEYFSKLQVTADLVKNKC